MSEPNRNKINNFITKIHGLITSHNNDSSCHSDLRTLINGKSNIIHHHTASDITDLDTLDVTITYEDDTTETKTLCCVERGS